MTHFLLESISMSFSEPFPLFLLLIKKIPLSHFTVSNISSVLVTSFKSLPKGKINFNAVFYIINQLCDEIHI